MSFHDSIGGFIVPILLSVIIGVIVPVMYSLTRTRDFTITAKIQQENVEGDIHEIKTGQDKIMGKLDEISRKQDNHEWRLKLLEDDMKYVKSRNGGGRSPV